MNDIEMLGVMAMNKVLNVLLKRRSVFGDPLSRYGALNAYRGWILFWHALVAVVLLICGFGGLIDSPPANLFAILCSPVILFIGQVISEFLGSYIDLADNSHKQLELLSELLEIEEFKLKRSGQMPRE